MIYERQFFNSLKRDLPSSVDFKSAKSNDDAFIHEMKSQLRAIAEVCKSIKQTLFYCFAKIIESFSTISFSSHCLPLDQPSWRWFFRNTIAGACENS
jgi:hypothetical protein